MGGEGKGEEEGEGEGNLLQGVRGDRRPCMPHPEETCCKCV